ncbi:hypothetical protein [Mycoplasma elephantis]|uniref:hypothetical protein n=1 Tax=Mycoplasma elephantis TaxID=114882 RepID=UPI0004857E0A|nr:hypothetical protein [Mycoplasma elephantis]
MDTKFEKAKCFIKAAKEQNDEEYELNYNSVLFTNEYKDFISSEKIKFDNWLKKGSALIESGKWTKDNLPEIKEVVKSLLRFNTPDKE